MLKFFRRLRSELLEGVNIVPWLTSLIPARGQISDSVAINIANKKGIETAFTNGFLNLEL